MFFEPPIILLFVFSNPYIYSSVLFLTNLSVFLLSVTGQKCTEVFWNTVFRKHIKRKKCLLSVAEMRFYAFFFKHLGSSHYILRMTVSDRVLSCMSEGKK